MEEPITKSSCMIDLISKIKAKDILNIINTKNNSVSRQANREFMANELTSEKDHEV
jgi:hypothetical protein